MLKTSMLKKVLVEAYRHEGPSPTLTGFPSASCSGETDSFCQRRLDPLTTDCLTSNAFSKVKSAPIELSRIFEQPQLYASKLPRM